MSQAVVELADEFVPDPTKSFLVAVAASSSVLVERPSAW